nr:hypothetical protein [uncultured Butyrivibrio sp.]
MDKKLVFHKPLFEEAAQLVNREDDMGLEGLRQAKESYNPIGYARKYRILEKAMCNQTYGKIA